MLRRGYSNGLKIIEVIDGHLDVVLYNDKGSTFYFYRFPAEQILGRSLGTRTIISQKEIVTLLKECGIKDYQGFVWELIGKAVDSGMPQRDEM